MLYILFISNIGSYTKSCEDWILSTTCNFHMFANRDRFLTYKTLTSRDVLMENNSFRKIIDIRTVKIKTFDGILEL